MNRNALQRSIVAVGSTALLVAGGALALSSGAGGQPRSAEDLIIGTDRAIVATQTPATIPSSTAEPAPGDKPPPRQTSPSSTTSRRKVPDTVRPPVDGTDRGGAQDRDNFDDDEHETVEQELREEEPGDSEDLEHLNDEADDD